MENPLQPHQQRVVDEKAELDVKLEALRAFLRGSLFETLNVSERSRLRKQAEIMNQYSQVLAQRIAHF